MGDFQEVWCSQPSFPCSRSKICKSARIRSRSCTNANGILKCHPVFRWHVADAWNRGDVSTANINISALYLGFCPTLQSPTLSYFLALSLSVSRIHASTTICSDSFKIESKQSDLQFHQFCVWRRQKLNDPITHFTFFLSLVLNFVFINNSLSNYNNNNNKYNL